MKTYSLTIKSSRKNLEKVEKFLSNINSDFQMDDYKFKNLLTAVTELVLNAIVHGNKESVQKNVKIDASINNSTLIVKVLDEGKGMDKSICENPKLPEDLLNESGRGLFIVKNLINNVQYLNTPDGFCCVLAVNK